MTLQTKFFIFVAPVLLATAVVPPVLWHWESTSPVPGRYTFAAIFLLSILSVTALITVYFAAAFLVSRPMRKMATEMNRISTGKQIEPLIQANRADELGLAANGFNQVVDTLRWTSIALQAVNDDLERRVNLRAGELAGRNADLLMAEQRYSSIFENATEGIFQTAPDGRPLSANPAMVQMLAYQSEAQLLASITDVATQVYADPASRDQLFQLMATNGKVEDFEVEFLQYGGSRIWACMAVTAIRDSAGNIIRLQGFIRDITQLRLQRQRQQAREQLELDRRAVLEKIARDEPLSQTLEALCQAAERQWSQVRGMVLLNDETHSEIAAAPQLSAGFVLRIDMLLASQSAGDSAVFSTRSKFIPDILADIDWSPLHEAALNEGVLACNQVPILAGNGKPLGSLILFHAQCIEMDDQDLQAMQSLGGLCGLAIEHHQLIARLEYNAVHDPLTGLANRAQLESQLPKWISAAARQERALALMMIDLDGFKNVNDTLGHRAGDILLKQVSARLSDAIRESDILIRMGGDEFTLVATEIQSQSDVTIVADRLIRSLAAPFMVEGRELFVGASIGMAVYPNDGMDGSGLQRCADAAMYAAKAAGRNCSMRFDPSMGEAAMDRVQMEGQLHRAIAQNEFMLEYQPQVNRRDEIVGVEALLRWQHPQLGRISPARFIPLAEQCGLIVPIGTWVLHEACRQAMAWQASGCTPLPVAVNVSAMQFQQTDFLKILQQTLDATGLPPRCLELELTESLLLVNTADAIRKVIAVRDLGVGVAIDDFGTGYSSLAYLQKLPIDRLKIDQSFVRDLGSEATIITDRSRTAVITAITSLAASLGMRVVAEGVETVAQRDYLVEIGCDTLQGFLFSRPVHPERIEAMLRKEAIKHAVTADAA